MFGMHWRYTFQQQKHISVDCELTVLLLVWIKGFRLLIASAPPRIQHSNVNFKWCIIKYILYGI